ncbi:RtcB family protein [Cystobacter fuscus]
MGGGNHFAEVQRVEAVHDARAFQTLKLETNQLLLLVHSGSRGLGEHILRAHVDRHGAGSLAEESAEARTYLARHDQAVGWARANRAAIAERVMRGVGAAGRRVLDVCHNSVTPKTWEGERGWLHRKGAAPSDQGPVVIPGSRGALSYPVLPLGDGEDHAHSLAHGAGRKWTRTHARERLRERFTPRRSCAPPQEPRRVRGPRPALRGGPPAYKAIDRVVGDLVDAGLVRVVATLAPLLTYKTRSRRE